FAFFFFFQAEDGIRDFHVTGVQTCALPISALAVAFVAALALRNPLRVDVIRDRGVLAREAPGGIIENVYRIQLINTSESSLVLQLQASGLPGLDVHVERQAAQAIELEPYANKLVPDRKSTRLNSSHVKI